jgi:hypothetical protein
MISDSSRTYNLPPASAGTVQHLLRETRYDALP